MNIVVLEVACATGIYYPSHHYPGLASVRGRRDNHMVGTLSRWTNLAVLFRCLGIIPGSMPRRATRRSTESWCTCGSSRRDRHPFTNFVASFLVHDAMYLVSCA